jgi:hypothetical protein
MEGRPNNASSDSVEAPLRALFDAVGRFQCGYSPGNFRLEKRQAFGRTDGEGAEERQFRAPSLAAAATASGIVAIEIAIGADHFVLSLLCSARFPTRDLCRVALHQLFRQRLYSKK